MSLINRKVDGLPAADIERMARAAQKWAPKPRMAAEPEVIDKLDALLSEIRDEGAEDNLNGLVQDALDYLPQRRAELGALSSTYETMVQTDPVKAAVLIEKALGDLGELKGGVPMPIISKNDTRTHTDYRTDSITGQQVVVPVMNPDKPEEVLKTRMGYRPDDVDQADEVISKRALQLMGYKVDMPQNSMVADFQVTDRSGNRMAIDGMQISQGKPIEMQTHSFVAPLGTGRRTLSVGETQALLDRGYQQGTNVIDQIDQLADRGQMLYPDTAKKAGKVLRGDRTQHRVDAELEYDALIMPEYSESIRNGPRHLQPRNLVTAPQGILMADMPAAYDAIRAGQAGKPEVVPNYGGNTNRNGKREQKDWHKVNVPMDRDIKVDGQRVIIDAVKAEPLVAQLLDQQTMNTLRVS